VSSPILVSPTSSMLVPLTEFVATHVANSFSMSSTVIVDTHAAGSSPVLSTTLLAAPLTFLEALALVIESYAGCLSISSSTMRIISP